MISQRKQNKNKPFILIVLEGKAGWEINYLKRKCCVAIISETFFSHGKDFFASTLLSGCLRITFGFLLIMFLTFYFVEDKDRWNCWCFLIPSFPSLPTIAHTDTSYTENTQAEEFLCGSSFGISGKQEKLVKRKLSTGCFPPSLAFCERGTHHSPPMRISLRENVENGFPIKWELGRKKILKNLPA